eukprot:170116-Pleurochrysis_carterae.AAC.1
MLRSGQAVMPDRVPARATVGVALRVQKDVVVLEDCVVGEVQQPLWQAREAEANNPLERWAHRRHLRERGRREVEVVGVRAGVGVIAGLVVTAGVGVTEGVEVTAGLGVTEGVGVTEEVGSDRGGVVTEAVGVTKGVEVTEGLE